MQKDQSDRIALVRKFVLNLNEMLFPTSVFIKYTSSEEYRDRADLLESDFLTRFWLATFCPPVTHTYDEVTNTKDALDLFQEIATIHAVFMAQKKDCRDYTAKLLERMFSQMAEDMMVKLCNTCTANSEDASAPAAGFGPKIVLLFNQLNYTRFFN